MHRPDRLSFTSADASIFIHPCAVRRESDPLRGSEPQRPETSHRRMRDSSSHAAASPLERRSTGKTRQGSEWPRSARRFGRAISKKERAPPRQHTEALSAIERDKRRRGRARPARDFVAADCRHTQAHFRLANREELGLRTSPWEERREGFPQAFVTPVT